MATSERKRLPTGLHDVELAALAAAGGRREFGELVRRHGAVVRGLLRRMGAEAATADDVAQDAFMQAYERIAEFRGDGPFPAWVKRIAVRQYLRRRKSDALLVSEDASSEQSEAAPDVGARIDLDEAMKGLNPAERMCVSLCYGAGFSHAEAAEALNAPLGTVKSHVKRGLDKLRERLAPDGRQAGSVANG
jgi:RNA polymerase sigma factor (sigma-70 family)